MLKNDSDHKAKSMDLGPKLKPEDTFTFSCGPHVPCFTECCGKLDLVLTPYDVLRLKTRLDMTSSDFLDKFASLRQRTPHGFPEFFMKMNEDSGNRCPFVTSAGCEIYEDRPGACRIYPIGRGSTKSPIDGKAKEFFFVVREDHCKGFKEKTRWKISDWLQDQNMEEYNRVNDLLMELYVRKAHRSQFCLTERHLKMFVMACYNIERFRDFIFGSNFLRKFRLSDELVHDIRESDSALLEFAFQWLKFALFGDPTITIREGSPST
ncbi:MAG: uncharacterized protein QG577_2007 [Thermodesulfobacteriota bacterium]|nr:uncharacterized protein [Thermodesulfobacteriota bacterium]